jgi:HSP20 family protein
VSKKEIPEGGDMMNLQLRTLKNPNWEKEFEHLFNFSREDQWAPSVEIFEEEKFFSVSLDVPGMKPAEIDIEIKDNRLFVSGERKTNVDQEKVLRSERRYGKFSRIFTLPQDVNTEAIEARFEEGVLTVVLPKVAKAQPKKITITTAPVTQ